MRWAEEGLRASDSFTVLAMNLRRGAVASAQMFDGLVPTNIRGHSQQSNAALVRESRQVEARLYVSMDRASHVKCSTGESHD
jgi:hypothetical protein